MMSTEELKKQKERLESALADVNLALNHDEYTNPFEFKRMDTIQLSHLKHPLLKDILSKCIQNDSGFDPNLITQHIEHEALDQFNDIVKTKIKGLSIKTLMTMRHELELLMLKERHDHYTKEIDKANAMLLTSISNVPVEPLANVTKIDKRRKANKE